MGQPIINTTDIDMQSPEQQLIAQLRADNEQLQRDRLAYHNQLTDRNHKID